MNTAKAIELALVAVIRDYANLMPGVTLRAWQSLRADATWDEEQDRTFPLIEVRASPPRTDDNASTMQTQVSVLVGTLTADDKDHAQISDIYSDVQAAIDRLYAQFRVQVAGDEYNRFEAVMGENTTLGTWNLGGFTYGDPLSPADDAGANIIGISLIVHHSNDNF
jgi:hypothetical protein